jgi:hypothetical protein
MLFAATVLFNPLIPEETGDGITKCGLDYFFTEVFDQPMG